MNLTLSIMAATPVPFAYNSHENQTVVEVIWIFGRNRLGSDRNSIRSQ